MKKSMQHGCMQMFIIVSLRHIHWFHTLHVFVFSSFLVVAVVVVVLLAAVLVVQHRKKRGPRQFS